MHFTGRQNTPSTAPILATKNFLLYALKLQASSAIKHTPNLVTHKFPFLSNKKKGWTTAGTPTHFSRGCGDIFYIIGRAVGRTRAQQFMVLQGAANLYPLLFIRNCTAKASVPGKSAFAKNISPATNCHGKKKTNNNRRRQFERIFYYPKSWFPVLPLHRESLRMHTWRTHNITGFYQCYAQKHTHANTLRDDNFWKSNFICTAFFRCRNPTSSKHSPWR